MTLLLLLLLLLTPLLPSQNPLTLPLPHSIGTGRLRTPPPLLLLLRLLMRLGLLPMLRSTPLLMLRRTLLQTLPPLLLRRMLLRSLLP